MGIDRKKLRVLCIDDAALIRSTVKQTMLRLGLGKVDDASSAEGGLRFMERETYDLMLCDWVMPGMTGIELLRHLREKKIAPEMKFVMVTALSQEAQVREAIELGVAGYIIKPFTPLTLASQVEQILGLPPTQRDPLRLRQG